MEQSVGPELSVNEIVKLYFAHWRMFAYLTVLLMIISAVAFAWKIPYVATSTIVVNDVQNSPLQAFSSQFFGLSKTVQDSKKGSSLVAKHVEFLKTREFYEELLQKIEVRGNSKQITLEEREGYEILKAKFLSKIDPANPESKTEVLLKFDKWLKSTLDTDFEIKVVASTPNRPMSLFLANTAGELTVETLKRHELEEITRVQGFISNQKNEVDQQLVAISKQLAELQSKDKGVMPLASKDKMGEYVSDLLVRVNETKMKIAENKKMIEYLNTDRSNQTESALYGVGGRIEALRIQNGILASKLAQLQISIDQVKSQVKELPFEAQMVDDLKKKSDLEFARFKELDTTLAKLDAEKLSIDTRFEVLDGARWETTLPLIGVLALGLLSVLLAQFFGSIVIYFKYLWNPEVLAAQASRDVMAFDNHSFDPRVIIENSKIKFSLKNPDNKEVGTEVGKESKKLAWNVFHWGRSTDITQ